MTNLEILRFGRYIVRIVTARQGRAPALRSRTEIFSKTRIAAVCLLIGRRAEACLRRGSWAINGKNDNTNRRKATAILTEGKDLRTRHYIGIETWAELPAQNDNSL